MSSLGSAARRSRALVRALTAVGRAVAAGALGCVLLGSILGWPELVLLAAIAALGLVVSALSVLGSGRFSVERSMHPTRLQPGQSAMGLLRIRNEGRARRRSIRAIDRVGDRELSIDIPPISSGEATDVPFSVLGERRGVIPVGPLWIGRADPFGLIRRRHAEGKVMFLLVHPRTTVLPVGGTGWAKDLEGPTTHDSPLGSVAFHSLRDYVAGDDRRHIHWRSTARAGHPIVRQFVDTRRSSNLLVLDGRPHHYESADLAETAIEIIASLAVSMQDSGQPTVCQLGDGRQMSDRVTPVLDRLARFQFRSAVDPSRLVADALDGDVTPTTVIVVTGADVPPEELVAVGAAGSRAAQVIVVQVSSSGTGVIEDRAHRSLVRVRTLEEFPHVWTAMRSARRA